MTHHDLFGKTIMVTGASRGIGSAIASHLASLGAQVAITYTSKPDLAMQVSAGLPGSGHLVVPLDLNDESSIQGAFDATLEKFGRLDGLVNNAGLTHDQLLLRMKAEDFDKVVQSNLRGTFLCTRIASKIMIKARLFTSRASLVRPATLAKPTTPQARPVSKRSARAWLSSWLAETSDPIAWPRALSKAT